MLALIISLCSLCSSAHYSYRLFPLFIYFSHQLKGPDCQRMLSSRFTSGILCFHTIHSLPPFSSSSVCQFSFQNPPQSYSILPKMAPPPVCEDAGAFFAAMRNFQATSLHKYRASYSRAAAVNPSTVNVQTVTAAPTSPQLPTPSQTESHTAQEPSDRAASIIPGSGTTAVTMHPVEAETRQAAEPQKSDNDHAEMASSAAEPTETQRNGDPDSKAETENLYDGAALSPVLPFVDKKLTLFKPHRRMKLLLFPRTQRIQIRRICLRQRTRSHQWRHSRLHLLPTTTDGAVPHLPQRPLKSPVGIILSLLGRTLLQEVTMPRLYLTWSANLRD
jgi:hypothetical protein